METKARKKMSQVAGKVDDELQQLFDFIDEYTWSYIDKGQFLSQFGGFGKKKLKDCLYEQEILHRKRREHAEKELNRKEELIRKIALEARSVLLTSSDPEIRSMTEKVLREEKPGNNFLSDSDVSNN